MQRNVYSKIKTIDGLAKILEDLRKAGKKIVHCHGVFDLLHPGHVKHFEAAKKKGDVLVVTITQDRHVNRGPGRPIFNQHLRAENIAAIEFVDFVAINEWPVATETIKRLRPHFYIKGSDYRQKDDDITGKIYEEENAIKSVGGILDFTDEISFSSSSLINTYLTPYPDEAKDFFSKFRAKYTADDVIAVLKKTANVKILVVGDIIIDEYHYCTGMGKSQKENIIATKYINEETFAGGVLAAANHLAGFCRDVTLLSCMGLRNDYKNFIYTHLKQSIKTKIYEHKDNHTVLKRRFVDPNFLHKLFEICYLDDASPFPHQIENDICRFLNYNLKKYDVVLVTDFGHGLITSKIVDVLAEKAKFLAVNVQTNSANIGFNVITKFPRADYVCIDEPEIRLACHDRFSHLESLVTSISKKIHCKQIIVTRGHKGSLVYSNREKFFQIPIFSKEVVDRIGAGDAYFSLTSPCIYQNNPMEVVGFIGNAVGALKVLIVGNRASVEPVPLFKYIATLLK